MFETGTNKKKLRDPSPVQKSSAFRDAFLGLFQNQGKRGETFKRVASNENRSRHEGKTWDRIVIVANRLPFNIKHDPEGKPSVSPSSGGLVTAMSPLLSNGVGGKWVGWPGTDKDNGLEEAVERASNGNDIGIVSLTVEEVEQYYEGYSNKILAPIFEGATDKVDLSDADEHWVTYQRVQKKFAKKVEEDLRPKDIIWIHDWHLTGVGKELSAMGVTQPMGFFLHIPFPTKEHFALVPHREIILENLLAHDIVGFQTNIFKQNFLDTVALYIPEAVIEKISDTITLVRIGEKVIRVGNFPISIDPKEFLEQSEAFDTKEYARQLDKDLRKNGEVQLIFNAGRLDYIKGFYEELLAFDLLLEKHPELIGKIMLYQLVIPSRENIDEYKEYKKQIIDLSEKINEKYRALITQKTASKDTKEFVAYEGMPVRQVHAHMDRKIYLAHLHVADIQSVPTKADGMNLIAKEGAVVGKSTMVQLLGKVSGAAEELGEYSLLIDPENTEAFADTLYHAYMMTDAEKKNRKGGMLEVVQNNDVFSWWLKDQEPAFQQVWDEKGIENTI